MEEVKSLLQQAGLSRYLTVFEEHGYDSLSTLVEMGPADFEQLTALTKILPGHLVRLKSRISTVRAQANTATTRNHTGPTGYCVPLIEDVATAALSASKQDAKEAQTKPSLKKAYNTWKEAKLASYKYNTQLGCSVMLDNNIGGGRKRVFRCRSVLSKRKLQHMMAAVGPTRKCCHVMWWAQIKGIWRLNEEKSRLEHMPLCPSGQNVRICELVNDPNFVKHVGNDQKCTGKSALRNALGFGGRLDGALTEQTARRARNKVNHYTDTDYDDDWCKLHGWKRQFEQQNPRSRCVILADEENRFGPNIPTSHNSHNCILCTHNVGPTQVQENVRQCSRCREHCLWVWHEILCCGRRILKACRVTRRATTCADYPGWQQPHSCFGLGPVRNRVRRYVRMVR